MNPQLLLSDLDLDKCDIKFAETEGTFSGYGNVFNVVDSKNEIVMPGAFAKVIKAGDPVDLYVNHGWLKGQLPIGSWTDLKEDHYGLFGQSSIVMEMTTGRDAYWAVKRNLVKGLSIGARPSKNGVEINTKGQRLIHEYEYLKEISIVGAPANHLSEVTSIKFDGDEIKSIETIKDFEHYLRDVGNLSRDHAKMLVAQAKIILNQREADNGLDQKSVDLLAERLSKFKVPE
ncbi:HK97 family phage prohead protease [Methylophilus sp. Leaf414]|uniref:HK97 family phage prohead protease n=1 Tax=Methylophilus sp. Leaf414 TaxID=1736371 RepID=UPI000700C77A|nr:HK97 family phage prohead protease [Methylophilus sp. Leaf414]KQT37687.1 hypothetical protein ASG24_01440 [Methylophilus sp. Leaf414]